MNTLNSRLYSLVTAVILLAGAGRLGVAQQDLGSITGRVTDKTTGTGLPGVRILLLNTPRSTSTNTEGRYVLAAVPAGAHQVRVSTIGYAAQTQSVTASAGSPATLDFGLTPAPISLDAVTVTPTGEQFAREVGNPVAVLNAQDIIKQAQPANFADLLSGRAAHVQVLQAGGSVGTGVRIRIRGISSVSLSNEPAYYVDGARVEAGGGNAQSLSIGTGGQATSRVNDLNVEDIQSIEVVKGPAAATLYGTQAGNGVVRITTRQGVAGAPQFAVYSELGVLNDKNNYPDNMYSWGHLLPDTFKANVRLTQCLLITSVTNLPGKTFPRCAIDSLSSFNVLRDPTTSPYGTGYRGRVGVHLSGGNDQTRYYLSGEYGDEIGVLRMPSAEYARLTAERAVDTLPYNQYRPNEVKSVSTRANLQTNLSSTADLTLSAGLVQSNTRLPQNDNNITGVLGSGLFGKGWSTAFQNTLPALPAGASQGRQWGFFLPGDVFSTLSRQDITRLTSSAQANWRPTTAITGRATIGLDYTDRMDIQFQQLGQGPSFSDFRQGRRQDNRFQLAHYTVDAGLSAVQNLTPEVNARTSVGVQYLKDRLFANFAFGKVFPPGGQQTGAGAVQTDSETTVEAITLGAYVEERFGWKDRRFITAGLRADDNSAFGSSFKAVYYPKVQGSWVISEEPFFPTTSWVSSLRLRAAYGASGVQPGSIDALRFYQPITAPVNGNDTPGLIISAVGNDSLKPERSTELELGLDAEIVKTRAHLEFTYYHKKTSDALVQRLLPPSLGASNSRFENLGSVLNQGVEGLLTVNFDVGPSVTVDAALSASHNSNKLISLGGNVQPIILGSIRHVPGYPLFGYWDRPILSYSDANGNGIIEPSEVTVGDTAVFLGSSIPTTNIALNAGVSLLHDRIRVAGQLDYRGGYKTNNFTDYFRCTSAAANNCRAVNDPSASLADQAAAAAARTLAYGRTVAGYIVDGTFLAVRELSVTYNAPDSWARAIRGNRLSLTATARNLVKWTNYSGIDPEVNGNGQSDQAIDFLTAPTLKTFTFRLNVGF
jgi:TonB-linked SusC/RagA family outer membrane protein